MRSKRSSLYAAIYEQVRRIPEGRVATYGQIADLAGFPRHARSVGYSLAALNQDDDLGDDIDLGDGSRERLVPWQRVINSQGRVSERADPGFEGLQEEMLRSEGIEISLDGKIDLSRFRWRPPT